MPKMPPKDEKELQQWRDMIQKGMDLASKDPEKYMYLRRQQRQMIKPWEDYLKDWDPKKKEKAKDKEAAVRVASKFAARADLDELQEGLADLEALSENLSEMEHTFNVHFATDDDFR